MSSQTNSPKSNQGFTLIEVLISVSILGMLFVGIFNLIDLMLGVTNNNKNYISAIAIANEKMEFIKNLDYDQVGTIYGSPAGVVAEYEYQNIFTIHSTVIFYDDAYDGIESADPVFTDYKIATVKVTWPTKNGTKDVTVFSKIIPLTEETMAGYGLLKLQIVDANGAPVSGATIHVQKDTAPIVNADYTSDINGYKSIPLLPAVQGYNVTVTKAGYSSDQTYAASTTNPSPYKPPYTIIAANKTEDSLKIDRLATINFETVADNTPENFRVSASSSTDRVDKIRAQADGSANTYYAWLHSSSSNSSVYIQKFDSTNAKQWADNKLAATSTPFQDNPDLAVVASGDSYVVWDDNSITLKSLAQGEYTNTIAKDSETPTTLGDQSSSNLATPKSASLFALISQNTTWLFNQLVNFIGGTTHNSLAWLDSKFSHQVTAAVTDITFVASTGNTADSWQTLTISKPTGVTQNDLLLAYIHNDDYNDGAITPPSGWSTLDNDMRPGCTYNNDSRGSIFYKIAGASEASSYTFSSASGQVNRKAGQIRAYRNVDTGTIFDGSLQETYTSDGDRLRPAPSHTVSNDGSMLVTGWGTNTNDLGQSSPTFPSGMANTRNNYADSATTLTADLSVDISNSPTGTKNLDANRDVEECTLGWSLVLKSQSAVDDVTVSAYGNQITQALIPSLAQHLGGTFVIKENTSSRNINSVKITESGTVNAQTDLSNVSAFYDLDTSAPYDCASESFSASDSQFGSTGTFNGADGSITFSPGSGINITTTKSLCVYVIAAVNSTATANQTIELKINNPYTDVVPTTGLVAPALTIELSQTTTLALDTNLNQVHYRFRADDNTEASSTWSTSQDTPHSLLLSDTTRLRLEVANKGDITATATAYQLEFGKKVTTCAAIASWSKVLNDNSQDWKINLSSNITDNANSTNVDNGLVDENPTFVAGRLSDMTNPVSGITLNKNEFTELEFSLSPTNIITAENTYCFRLTNAGSVDKFTYTSYPEVSVTGDRNVFITSLDSSGNERFAIKKLNSDSTNSNQTNPRIATTNSTSSATSTVVWVDDRNGNFDIYAQAIDNLGNKLWATDLQITSSSTNESPAVIAFDQTDDNFVTAWVSDTGSSKELYLQKFSLTPTPIWTDPILATADVGDKINPSITIDNANNIYLAWETITSGLKKAQVAMYNATGTLVWQKNVNSDNATGNQSKPTLKAYGTGIYVAFVDDRDSNSDIYSQKINAAGALQWINDQRLNINLGITEQINPTLTLNSSSEPFAAWQDFRHGTASSTYSSVYATKFGEPGTMVADPNLPLIIKGTKEIGPGVLKYSESHTTNASGELNLSLEWDPSGYTAIINTALSTKVINLGNPTMPLRLLPAEAKTLILYTE